LKLNYPEEETIDNLDQELQNLRGMAHRISAYMKMNDLEIGPINLPSVVTEAISLLKDITSDPIFTDIELFHPPSIPWVKGNFVYLQQAFLNILLIGSRSIRQHGSPSNMKIEISDDPFSKMSTIQIRYPWSSLMGGDNSLKSHTEIASLNFVQKVLRFHQGELQVSRNDDGEAVITITLPASTSSSD
jgi:signal transduction histidine kinase